jgi:hypothetical protein
VDVAVEKAATILPSYFDLKNLRRGL